MEFSFVGVTDVELVSRTESIFQKLDQNKSKLFFSLM
jgi:hypothetical protein